MLQCCCSSTTISKTRSSSSADQQQLGPKGPRIYICWHVFRNNPVFANTCPGFTNEGSFLQTRVPCFTNTGRVFANTWNPLWPVFGNNQVFANILPVFANTWCSQTRVKQGTFFRRKHCFENSTFSAGSLQTPVLILKTTKGVKKQWCTAVAADNLGLVTLH